MATCESCWYVVYMKLSESRPSPSIMSACKPLFHTITRYLSQESVASSKFTSDETWSGSDIRRTDFRLRTQYDSSRDDSIDDFLERREKADYGIFFETAVAWLTSANRITSFQDSLLYCASSVTCEWYFWWFKVRDSPWFKMNTWDFRHKLHSVQSPNKQRKFRVSTGYTCTHLSYSPTSAMH